MPYPLSQIYNLTFAATLTQFNTMISTTLPAAGFSVIQAPNNFAGLIKPNPITLTGTLTSTSPTVTAVASTAGLVDGMLIVDTTNPLYIPSGTTITSFVANTSILMSANAAGSSTDTLVATPAAAQIDFTYDGTNFVRFFGANPVLPIIYNSAGLDQNQMTSQLVNYLIAQLAGTLGAPIPANQAVPTYNTNSI